MEEPGMKEIASLIRAVIIDAGESKKVRWLVSKYGKTKFSFVKAPCTSTSLVSNAKGSNSVDADGQTPNVLEAAQQKMR